MEHKDSGAGLVAYGKIVTFIWNLGLLANNKFNH